MSQGRTVSRRWVRGILMAMTLAMASCASWQTQYLKGAVNQATMETVEKRLGRPHATWELRTGESLWTYQSGVPSGTDAGGLTIVGPDWVLGRRSTCSQYVLLFDQQRILRAWMQQPCQPDRGMSRVPAVPQAPAPSPTEADPRPTPDKPSPPRQNASGESERVYCGGWRSASTSCRRQPSGSRKLTVVRPVAATKFGVLGIGMPCARSPS